MAGDPSFSRPGIPSWQRQEQSQTNQKPTKANPQTAEYATASSNDDAGSSEGQSNASPEPDIQATLVEQASRFLQDPQIRDASPTAKRTFLSSKGLDEASLEKTRHLIDSSSQSESSQQDQQHLTPTRSSSTPSPPSQPETEPPEQIPPIITYPEFLLHSRKPPPLITARRVANVAYAATGAAALVYGISQYLVGPMTDSLMHARHDFATHAQKRVDELNERLLASVSNDPGAGVGAHSAIRRPEESDNRGAEGQQGNESNEDEEDDDDPTELFHRDFGTQTSTPPPPRHNTSSLSSINSSSSAFNDDHIPDQDATKSTLTSTLFSLHRLRTLSSSLSADHLVPESTTASEISTVVRVLSDYLDSMTYPSYSSSSNAPVIDMTAGAGSGVTGGGSTSGAGYGSDGMPRKGRADDEVANLRAEIRSVKGVLLSARNFPGGGSGSRSSGGGVGGGGLSGTGVSAGAGASAGGRKGLFPPAVGVGDTG